MNRRHFLRNGLWVSSALASPAIVRAAVLPSARRIATPTQISGAWTPLSVAGCKLWLDASQIVGLNDGDDVTVWPDLSGQGNNATTLTSAPTYETGELNGLAVVRFTAANNDRLQANGVSSVFSGEDKAFTVFVVTNLVANNSGYYFWGAGSSGGTVPMCYVRDFTSSNRLEYFKRDDASTQNAFTPTLGSANPQVVTCTNTGTAVKLYVDGTASSEDAEAVGQTTLNRFGIGCVYRSTPTGNLDGDIAELIVYDTALGDTDRGTVETYLADKWIP